MNDPKVKTICVVEICKKEPEVRDEQAFRVFGM